MKKYLLMFMFFLLFAGCQAAEEEKIELVESDTILSATSDIALAVKEDSITDTGLILLITNETSHAFSFGCEYDLEVKKDDRWRQLEIKMAIPAIGLILGEGPGNTNEFYVHWNKGDLSEGEYRVVKEIGPYTLAAEFVYDADLAETGGESSETKKPDSAASGVYQYNAVTKEETFIPEESFLGGSSSARSLSSEPGRRND